MATTQQPPPTQFWSTRCGTREVPSSDFSSVVPMWFLHVVLSNTEEIYVRTFRYVAPLQVTYPPETNRVACQIQGFFLKMKWFQCWQDCWHILIICLCVLQLSVDRVATRIISGLQQSIPDHNNDGASTTTSSSNSYRRWKRQETQLHMERLVIPNTRELNLGELPASLDSNELEDPEASQTGENAFNSLWWSSLCGNQDNAAAAKPISPELDDQKFVLRIEHEVFDTRLGLLSGLTYTVKVKGTESGREWVTGLSGGTWQPMTPNHKGHLLKHCPVTFTFGDDQKRRRRRKLGPELRRSSTTRPTPASQNFLPGFATHTKEPAADYWLLGPTHITSFPCRIDEHVDQVTFRIYWIDNTGQIRWRWFTFPVLRDCHLFPLPGISHVHSRHLPLSSNYRSCNLYVPLRNATLRRTGNDFPHSLEFQLTELQVKSGTSCDERALHGLTLFRAAELDMSADYGAVIRYFAAGNTSHSHQVLLRHYCGLLADYGQAALTTRTYANWTLFSVHLSAIEDEKSGFNMSIRRLGPCDAFLWTQQAARWQLVAPQKVPDHQKTNKCQFQIHLPFGYQVQFKVQLLCADHLNCTSSSISPDVGQKTSGTGPTGPLSSSGNPVNLPRTIPSTERESNLRCTFMQLQLEDASGTTVSCLNSLAFEAEYPAQQYISDSNALHVTLTREEHGYPWEAVGIEYSAIPDVSLTSGCEYGWVNVAQQCMRLINTPLTWPEAEQTCVSLGGHLAAITDQYQQDMAHDIIINSAHYNVNAGYWLGGTDHRQETVFEWTSGQSWTYSHWFPGWEKYQFYNAQPSDDGDNEGQDCLEMRQTFRTPYRGQYLTTNSLYWNDRNCQALNAFLCQKPAQRSGPQRNTSLFSCNITHELTRQQPTIQFRSRNYPGSYPSSTSCFVQIVAPSGYLIVYNFHHFDLEYHEQCNYDYVEFWEAKDKVDELEPVLRRCGNWNARLKLLRHQSRSNRSEMRFKSDVSYVASGYEVTATIERASFSCSDPRHHIFNNSCYLIITYPEVTYQTARDVCRGFQADLAQLNTPEEANFLRSKIVLEEFNATPFYWISISQFATPSPGSGSDGCLGFEPTEVSNLAFQWHSCKALGGYLCQKSLQGLSSQGIESSPVFHQKVQKAYGEISSPAYPDFYPNNQHYQVVIQRPFIPNHNFSSRILFHFHHLDLEYQDDCLYDYIGLQATPQGPMRRFCGHETNLQKLDFVSETDQLWVTFHSDYSISGQGFSASWTTVDLVGCPEIILETSEGEIQTPNYPHSNLPNMDCAYKLRAPEGFRVWLQILDLDLGVGPDSKGRCREEWVQIHIAEHNSNLAGNRTWLRLCGIHTSEKPAHTRHFLSLSNQLTVRYHTTQGFRGRGFRALYQFISAPYEIQSEDELVPGSSGTQFHAINYPLPSPTSTRLLHRFYTQPGYVVHLRLWSVYQSLENDETATHDQVCSRMENNNSLRVWDPAWNISSFPALFCLGDLKDAGSDGKRNPVKKNITYNSEFNSLLLDYAIDSPAATMPNIVVQVSEDPDFAMKMNMSTGLVGVDGCSPNFCQNSGDCVTVVDSDFHYCNCSGYWTGMFCTLTLCDRQPCVHGTCDLTDSSYVCSCEPGFAGKHCDMPTTPCDENPCQNNGDCLLTPDGFQCRCHAWWRGPRCEIRWLHIPYKPLSQRMLEEPFWLGLITMAVVLVLIGLVWCIRRHFPEKLERFVTEELDRQKQISPTGWRRGFSAAHRASIEPILAQGHGTTLSSRPSSPLLPCNGASLSAPTRTLLSRLNFRKPSLLSLSSAISPSAYSNTQQDTSRSGRTFSLDDLFRITRRSPSPGKRGSDNDVATAQRREAERHQLLQRLVASRIPKPESNQISMDYLHEGREGPKRALSDENSDTDSMAQLETSFGKNEKKVTFARMLSLVAAEIDSSNSDLSGADDANKCKDGSTGVTLQVTAEINPAGGYHKRHRSRPWAGRRAWKSPNSTSSTQGSASDLENGDTPELSSSETPTPVSGRRHKALRLPVTGKSSSPSTLTIHQANRNLATKTSSADSLLSMLRGLSAGVGQHRTPSTPSSPQVESDLDGGNSSCYPTPLSTPGTPSGNAADHGCTNQFENSPTISVQVPVFDPSNLPRTARSNSLTVSDLGNNTSYMRLEPPSQSYGNWLSPIHEVPTPLPSPAHTPIPTLRRQQAMHTGARSDGDESSSSSSRSESTTVLHTQVRAPPQIMINVSDEHDEETSLTPASSIPPSPVSLSSPKHKPPPLIIVDSNFSRFQEPTPPPIVPIPVISIITVEENTSDDPPAVSGETIPEIVIPEIDIIEPDNDSSLVETQEKPTISWDKINIGSPPVKKVASMEFSSLEPNRLPRKSLGFESGTIMESGGPSRRLLREILDKSSSLDLPTAPPLITITSNLSEVESDTEPSTMLGVPNTLPVNNTMCYLSPYAYLGNRPVEMAASESNLSSSGYSSMASPGPSPCGSSKTLCESEDLIHPLTLRHQRRLQAIRALSPSLESSSPPDSPGNLCHKVLPSQLTHLRHLLQPHSDSEITDDPTMVEPIEHESTVENDSNDEGIGIDPIHEKIDSGEVKSAKDLESLMIDRKTTDSNKDLLQVLENCDLLDKPFNIQKSKSLDSKTTNLHRMSNLKSDSLDTKLLHGKGLNQNSLAVDILGMPALLETGDYHSVPRNKSGSLEAVDEERKRSPVSSRSESPLSDARNVNLGRFSRQCYGLTQRMDLPYTDSDGLYDYPSSEPKLHGIAPHRALRKSDRRRERKAYLQQQHGRANVLEVLQSSTVEATSSPGGLRRGSFLEPFISPKRRLRHQVSLDCNNTSSSSNESLFSPRFLSRKSPSSSPSCPLTKARSPPRSLLLNTAPSVADKRRKRREPTRLVSPTTSCQVQLTIEGPTSAEDDSSGEQCRRNRRQEEGTLTVFSKIKQMSFPFRMSPRRQESAKRREQRELIPSPSKISSTFVLKRSPSFPSSSSSLGDETEESSDTGEHSNDSLGNLAEIEDSPSPDSPTTEFSSYHSCSAYPSPSHTPIPPSTTATNTLNFNPM